MNPSAKREGERVKRSEIKPGTDILKEKMRDFIADLLKR
jgi:hypothetical protein